MTIKSRIQTRIKRAKRSVFLRSDFKYIAGYDQIGRVLRNIVSDGELIKIGYGLYVRAREIILQEKLCQIIQRVQIVFC